MYELYKNKWIDLSRVAIFTVSENKTSTTSLFLRRKKEKVTGYKFEIIMAGTIISFYLEVETKKERDEIIGKLTGVK